MKIREENHRRRKVGTLTIDDLYDCYYNELVLWADTILNDMDMAEDLVQEAFVRAYLSLPEDVPSFPYWLMRVCRNLLCDHRRKRRRHADGDPPERADSVPTPEERLLQREELIALYRAIARLSEDEQELLNLFYFARRPLSEIAQLTGMTPGAAKTRLYRARRHLRREMEEDGYGL